MVVYESKMTSLEFNCSGGTYGSTMFSLNGNIAMEGVSSSYTQDPASGIVNSWLSILPIALNNNTNITCSVIDVNGAVVESNSLMLQIQGNVLTLLRLVHHSSSLLMYEKLVFILSICIVHLQFVHLIHNHRAAFI